MKLSISTLTCAITLSLGASSIASTHNQRTFQMDAEVGAGLIHNSALSVDELDDVSSQGDSGHELTALVNAKWRVTDKTKLVTGYAYNQKQYNEYSAYDLALHQLNLDVSHKFDSLEVGLRLDGAKAILAGQTFLNYQQASMYLGKFMQPETYLRSSFKVKNKSFTELSSRDATGVGVNLDLFHFVNGAKTMLMVGVNAEQEQAEDQQFDYWGMGINAKVTHKFEVFGLASKVGLGARYQKKDYQSLTEQSLQGANTVERDENRKVVEANWQLHLTDNLSVKAQWQYGDYQSLISSQTYQQNMASVGLRYSF